MTKPDLQKELKEKVKEGVKPSDLKKLKKSKSLDDLTNSAPNPPLQKSKSQLEIPLSSTSSNQDRQISALQDELTTERQRVSSLRGDLAQEQEKSKQFKEKITQLQEQISN